MAWSRRQSAASRASLTIALLTFWGLGPGLGPVLAGPVDSRAADARGTTESGPPPGTRLIGLAHAEEPTSLSFAAQPSPAYRHQKSEGLSALSRLRLSTGLAQQGAAASDAAGARPFYRKTWFLAGAAGLAVVSAILLASGGSDNGRPPIEAESLPGFPSPPRLRKPGCVPAGANGPSR